VVLYFQCKSSLMQLAMLSSRAITQFTFKVTSPFCAIKLSCSQHNTWHIAHLTSASGEWTPGGEYVQKLKVKNVSQDLKKLKYRLPTSRYFSLAYPELIVLSPGTECIIDVVFRPVVEEVSNAHCGTHCMLCCDNSDTVL
jgi:hypothetical protein